MRLIKLRGCSDTAICPAVYLPDDNPAKAYIQGPVVTDPAVLSQLDIPTHEVLIEVELSLIAGIPEEDDAA